MKDFLKYTFKLILALLPIIALMTIIIVAYTYIPIIHDLLNNTVTEIGVIIICIASILLAYPYFKYIQFIGNRFND